MESRRGADPFTPSFAFHARLYEKRAGCGSTRVERSPSPSARSRGSRASPCAGRKTGWGYPSRESKRDEGRRAPMKRRSKADPVSRKPGPFSIGDLSGRSERGSEERAKSELRSSSPGKDAPSRRFRPRENQDMWRSGAPIQKRSSAGTPSESAATAPEQDLNDRAAPRRRERSPKPAVLPDCKTGTDLIPHCPRRGSNPRGNRTRRARGRSE